MTHHHELEMNQQGQKTFSGYLIGFLLSLTLTIMAFWLVEHELLSKTYLFIALSVLALTQLFVQCLCFLRLNASTEGRWNLLPFIFTIFIIAIFIGGSLWIMYHLNANMTH